MDTDRNGKMANSAWEKYVARLHMKWTEGYFDIQDQIDRAIEEGLNYINTGLCDFDRMTKEDRYEKNQQSKWVYKQLRDDGYILAICISGEPFDLKKKLYYADTFLHVRWEEKLLKFNIENRLLKRDTWKKDIPKELITSDNKEEKKWTYEDSNWKNIVIKSSYKPELIPINRSPTIKKRLLLKNNKIILTKKKISIRANRNFLKIKFKLCVLPKKVEIRREQRVSLTIKNKYLPLEPKKIIVRENTRNKLKLKKIYNSKIHIRNQKQGEDINY